LARGFRCDTIGVKGARDLIQSRKQSVVGGERGDARKKSLNKGI